MNEDNKAFRDPACSDAEVLRLILPATRAAAVGDTQTLEALLQQESWTPEKLKSLLNSLENTGNDIAAAQKYNNPQAAALFMSAIARGPDATTDLVERVAKADAARREKSVALIEARVEALTAKGIKQRSDSAGLGSQAVDDGGLGM